MLEMIPSWLIIGFIALAIAFLINRIPVDTRWFFRLKRPRWLNFEFTIPFIWIFIFACGIMSASLTWDSLTPSPKRWLLMGVYLLLEISILAYTPVMCAIRSLTVGTLIGAIGFIIGLILVFQVVSINQGAFFLLLPYLLWSPIGTYVTWEMIRLNPGNS
jgi:tryptophan-rich sensory protein